jgi:phosphoglycolate phosphatase-like HAD superfamily hydrolase
MPKTVCLDFDGVLSDYHGWRGPEVLDPPRAGVANFLKALKEAGYEIVIHTTRDSKIIWSWLIQHGLDIYFKE